MPSSASPPPRRAAQPFAEPVTTRVTGGLTSAPVIVPTYVDPATFDFTGICPEQWIGVLNGESTCFITEGHFDPATGNGTATIVDVFEGVSTIDQSHGTLTINERFAGNLYQGTGLIDGVIVGGTGDPRFACSAGHITLALYFGPVASYGGYDGTWASGCTEPRPSPSTPPLPQIAGGILSVPTGIPTSGDPSTFTIQGVAPEEWTGPLTGATVADIKWARVDPGTGDLTGHVVETFTGTYLGDHSTGTFVIDETVTGNVFTGAAFLDGTVISATGDPTFVCMLGSHISMPFFLNAVGSFGGYVVDQGPACV
jgi:hypothetical protein